MTKKIIHTVAMVLGVSFCFAQQGTEKQDSVPPIAGSQYHLGLFPKQAPSAVKTVSISGFYRFFATYSHMDDQYLLSEAGQQTTPENTLFIGDDAQLPNLWLAIGGRPTKQTSFNMDIFAFQFLDGNVGQAYSGPTNVRPSVFDPMATQRLGGNLGINLGINLTGTYNAKYGSFSARMGGTNWYYLSDLTFASFRGYNRFTLFERNPWDPVERNAKDRFQKYYDEGATNQDLRWGNRAFHGLILEGGQLPGDMSFSFLYGKTELNGGFDPRPNYSVGGRLRHESKNGFESLNTFNSLSYLDSLAQNEFGFNVVTYEMKRDWSNFGFHSEIGAGNYFSPDHELGWAEAINFKLHTNPKLSKIPIELHYFRIAPEVINNNALFWNTAIVEASSNALPAGTAGSNATLNPFSSSMIGIGQMTNNRTGVNLNTEIEIKKLKLTAGYGVTTEIEARSNTITLSHAVNQLTRSRFWRWNFTPEVGPYNRYNVVYRDAYESIQLTDDSVGTVVNRKRFNNLELQGKYATKVLNKDLYMFFLGRYNTASPKLHLLIPLNEDAYIRQYSTEIEMYYGLTPKLFWTSYAGYERVLGNYQTEVDNESRRPRNQTGWGVGTGFEMSIGKNALFLLKHRWFGFEDKNFVRDQFRGTETMAEIKVMF